MAAGGSKTISNLIKEFEGSITGHDGLPSVLGRVATVKAKNFRSQNTLPSKLRRKHYTLLDNVVKMTYVYKLLQATGYTSDKVVGGHRLRRFQQILFRGPSVQSAECLK